VIMDVQMFFETHKHIKKSAADGMYEMESVDILSYGSA
jgi:hypothetical protein